MVAKTWSSWGGSSTWEIWSRTEGSWCTLDWGDSHGLCAKGLASNLVPLGGGGTSSMGLSKSEVIGGVPAKGAVRPWSRPQFASRLHWCSGPLGCMFLPQCISQFPCLCVKIPDRWSLREGRKDLFWLSLMTQSIMVRKSWRHELEAAGHFVSPVRKQRQMPFSPSSSSGIADHRIEPSTVRAGLLTSLNNLEIPPQKGGRACFHGDSEAHQVDRINHPNVSCCLWVQIHRATWPWEILKPRNHVTRSSLWVGISFRLLSQFQKASEHRRCLEKDL